MSYEQDEWVTGGYGAPVEPSRNELSTSYGASESTANNKRPVFILCLPQKLSYLHGLGLSKPKAHVMYFLEIINNLLILNNIIVLVH